MESAVVIIDNVKCRVAKIYQYKAIVIEDRGHISDLHFLAALNRAGAEGWKHKEEQPKGSSKLAILLERELTVEEWLPDDGVATGDTGTVEEEVGPHVG